MKFEMYSEHPGKRLWTITLTHNKDVAALYMDGYVSMTCEDPTGREPFRIVILEQSCLDAHFSPISDLAICLSKGQVRELIEIGKLEYALSEDRSGTIAVSSNA